MMPHLGRAAIYAFCAPVLGRKNHFGSRSQRGTEVAAIFYTIVETAALQGLDPARYLLSASRALLEGALPEAALPFLPPAAS